MYLPITTKNLPTKYHSMLKKIESNLPAIQKDQQAFFKTQSQFMDNMLTVSHPTPLRNIRQILAEINKSKQALDQAYYKNKKREIKIKQKQRQLETATDDLERELIQTQIEEQQSNINSTMNYIAGAIRKISAYIEQYNSILNHIGKDHITEADFEREETRYHIGKAFEQALIAARSRNGVIDEGNHTYFQQIGINGAMAQIEVSEYLEQEVQLFSERKAPTHKMTLNWLNALMDKYEDCPSQYAEIKGMKLTDEQSLIGEK